MGYNEFFDVLIKVDRMLMLSVVCNLILGVKFTIMNCLLNLKETHKGEPHYYLINRFCWPAIVKSALICSHMCRHVLLVLAF